MTLSKELIDYVKGVIDRYAWGLWETKHVVKVNARVSRGKYRCACCEGLFGPRDVHVDHIEPRVDPLKGWEGFDIYVKRTFTDKLQVLCLGCHKVKTSEEAGVRAKARRKNR